jgi:hypothetical protein
MQTEKKRRWQFTIRDICLVTLIVALALGWWMERRRLAAELASARWIIEIYGFTEHTPVMIDPVEGIYVDDLSAFYETLKLPAETPMP